MKGAEYVRVRGVDTANGQLPQPIAAESGALLLEESNRRGRGVRDGRVESIV